MDGPDRRPTSLFFLDDQSVDGRQSSVLALITNMGAGYVHSFRCWMQAAGELSIGCR